MYDALIEVALYGEKIERDVKAWLDQQPDDVFTQLENLNIYKDERRKQAQRVPLTQPP
jgi:hypothetical protein